MLVKLVSVALLIPLLISCSSPATKLLLPTPVSVALTVGEWIIKDNKSLFVVDVEASAHTPEAARDEIFKIAVAKALGSLVLSEREIKNNKVVRDEFLIYSSGYVEDFQIKSEQQDGSLYKITATVWVSESKIADRLQESKVAAGEIDGERLARKYDSYHKQAKASDRIIESVLMGVPGQSFNVQVGKYSSRINNRALEIVVPFQISWNQAFLSAVQEALLRTREGIGPWDLSSERLPWAVAMRKKGEILTTYGEYSDEVKVSMFFKHFVEPKLSLEVKVTNSDYQTAYLQCFEVPELSGASGNRQFFTINQRNAAFSIDGDFEYAGTITLRLELQPHEIQKFASIEMRVVELVGCPR